MNKVRCAIYTRKSSDDGLEQSFNSLDAQREACAAYVLSQASEGWSALPDAYDDGGLSGGSLDRPALRRLLADIADGRIDIVVVYKVDRLTRSLLDFSRLVEAFDKAGTSFVSITQSFNTTTSMGRLTLNMLLSFAQFEREVTAERIRDKIAASKAKGMWMGGTPPLGYTPNGRTLAIVESDAVIIRDIYRRFLEAGNVRTLGQKLQRDGITVPCRATAGGRMYGGGGFMRGQLYAILKNPIYVGDIQHRGERYTGQQPAIVEREMWQRVQDVIAGNLQGRRTGSNATKPSPLAGLVVDGDGEPLVATHACKGRVRYRYYVSRALQQGVKDAVTDGLRIPAREIEAAVIERVAAALDDPLALMSLAAIDPEADDLRATMNRAAAAAEAIRHKGPMMIKRLVARVRALPRAIEISLSVSGLVEVLGGASRPGYPATITLTATVRLTRTGRAMSLVHSNGKAVTSDTTDASLTRLLVRARGWWTQLSEGEMDVSNLAKAEGVTSSYVTRVVRLAFLAPALVDAILAGDQKAVVDGTLLKTAEAIPMDWAEQMRGFATG